jgi:hypothetical protein
MTLLAKVAAASGTTPTRPIISVSATPISIWLTCPMIRGRARITVRRPSRASLS